MTGIKRLAIAIIITIFAAPILGGAAAAAAEARNAAGRGTAAGGPAAGRRETVLGGDAAGRGTTAGDPAPFPAEFYDVAPSDWFYPYITELSRRGLTRGNPDGGYAPDSPLLVDEFIAFTLRTLGEDIANADGYWAENCIRRALKLGLIDRERFPRCDIPITREQIADIAVRAGENSGFLFEKYPVYQDIFGDIGLAANPNSVLKAIELGVLAGYEDGTFRPDGAATRAEAAAIVLRMTDESYRLKLYDGILYCPKTDLNGDGDIGADKAVEFMMKSVQSLRIRRGENGKAVVSGVIPELPEGHWFSLRVSFFNEKNKYIGYASSVTRNPGEIIDWPGAFELETKADAGAVRSIVINLSVPRVSHPEKPAPYCIEGSASSAGMVIAKYYGPADPGREAFTMTRTGESGVEILDYALTDAIWGW